MTQLKSSTCTPSNGAAILDFSRDEQRLDLSFRKSELRFKDLGGVLRQFRRGSFDFDRVVRESRKTRGRINLAARLHIHSREEPTLAVLHIFGGIFHVHNRRRQQAKLPRALRQLSL